MTIVVLVVMLLTFGLVELAPGDAAAALAGEDATPESIQLFRERLGLDRPLLVRIGDYMVGAARFDFGDSLFTGKPVSNTIREAIPVTASLALVAMTIGVVVSLALGTVAALRRGRTSDRLISAGAALGTAVPPFILAIALVVPLALNRSLFPATGYASLSEGFGAWLRHLILPAITLGVGIAAELTRQVRGAMVDVLDQDFIRAKRASGLLRRKVILKHAGKNAAVPAVTVLGLQVGRLLGGAVLVEFVFAMNGLGNLTYRATVSQDIPVLQGVVVLAAVFVLLTNLLVDLSYGYFNPRIRRA